MQKDSLHNFHIPVMGIGFTIDTPAKVAHFGISSVISLVDDILIEKMRAYHSKIRNKTYKAITKYDDDFRAKRISAYLNLLGEIAQENFESMKKNMLEEDSIFSKYINMLPSDSKAKQFINQAIQSNISIQKLQQLVDEHLTIGSIDVNIMTKLDKENYKDGETLPTEFNDAHAALRGFANSKLNSSIVLSAGMNPRLYSYLEQFEDFYPDKNGTLNKKIILKVSDYRSALIQGKFLAKKGIWVSEYRIESGLNCGGHAFASEGYLLGSNLEEFKVKREELVASVYEIYTSALNGKSKVIPAKPLSIKITAQGGVGTEEEHNFLLKQYNLDSIGWGTPFLLVPEVVSIDKDTLDKLCKAQEEDLYLSNISPLGVPFNSLKGNTKDKEKEANILKNRPGSSCPKEYASLSKEFTNKSICVASRQYQNLKIKELNAKDLDDKSFRVALDRITEKSCICTGLGTAALLSKDLSTKTEGSGVSVCPGPNMAYYSKISTLVDMANHIYGRAEIEVRKNRPNFLIKELALYIDYLNNKIIDPIAPFTEKQIDRFTNNLLNGIEYYSDLFKTEDLDERKLMFQADLEILRLKLNYKCSRTVVQ